MDSDTGNSITQNNDDSILYSWCPYYKYSKTETRVMLRWFSIVILGNFTLQNDDSLLKSLSFSLTNIQDSNSVRQ